MRTRYAALAIVLAVASTTRQADAQRTPGAGLDSATSAAIAPIIEQARSANLPLEPLYAKAREGQVQGVPAARIEVAVRAIAGRLQTANEALAPNASEPELSAAADAIKHGVPAETLRLMRKAGRDGSLAVPIGVLTQLIVRGIPVEQASVKIVDLLQRGAVSNHFIALDDRVRADVLAGKRPDESLDLRMRGIIPNLPQSATATTDAIQATSPGNRKRP